MCLQNFISKCIYIHSINGKCLFDSSPFQALFCCKTRIKALHKRSHEFFSLRRIPGFLCVGRSLNFKLWGSWSGGHLNCKRRYAVIILLLYRCRTSGMSFPFTPGLCRTLSRSEERPDDMLWGKEILIQFLCYSSLPLSFFQSSNIVQSYVSPYHSSHFIKFSS